MQTHIRNKLLCASFALSCLLSIAPSHSQSPVAADVIVVIDESGSMASEQAWIRDAIPFLEESLVANGIGSESQLNEYGLVGFGNSAVVPRGINVGDDLLGSADEFTIAAQQLVTRGGTEDGWRGIDFALSDYPRRDGAAVNIILVTDEDRDNTNSNITYQTVLEKLNTNRALLNAVVNVRIRCEDGTEALGMDSQGVGYIADGSGGFTTCANPTATSGAGRSIVDYVDLAIENGGAAWDLDFLRDGGTSAQSFTAALLAIKVDEILNQRPIGDLVAVARATPDPSLINQEITLDGSQSFHLIDGRTIVAWDWDLDNDGIFDASGPIVSTSYPALGEYLVTLRITDDSDTPLTTRTRITINVNIPPLKPTANANGPYLFCPQNTPWRLDGSLSVNPDDGLSEAGLPGDQIIAYEWDINNDQVFDDATGATVDATSDLSALGVGDHIIRLRVTDNTEVSFPSSNLNNLSDTQITQVRIRDASDALCNCLVDLAARPKLTKVQLTWTDSQAASYAIYRSTDQGGPYQRIATTDNRYSTYLDPGLELDTTYYYVVEELSSGGQAICRSREISATPSARRINNLNRPPVITSTPVTIASEGLAYTYDVEATDPDRRERLTYTLEVAPTGMTINAANGLIDWTPINAQVGQQVVLVKVVDNQGAFVEQVFTITVANLNQAPVITGTPVTTATELQAYSYQVVAIDPDLNDSLRYSLTNAPSNMSIGESTGLISWTPQLGQLGETDVTVRVADAEGLFDTLSFVITVAERNLLPVINSSPVVSATASLEYTYQVFATDGNGDDITYALGVFPEGMIIDPLTGLIEWTPSEAQIGSQQVTVVVSDTRNGSGSQNFNVLVEELNVAPTITTITLPDAQEDLLYTQTLLANDENTNDFIAYTVRNAPGNLSIDPSDGTIRWLPVSNNVGQNSVTFRVTDIDGLFDEKTFVINVLNSSDAPAIASEPVLSGAPNELYEYQVLASDADGDTLTYTLQRAPEGMQINASSGLITWIPEGIQAGSNAVTVRATDTDGLFNEQNFLVLIGSASQPLAPQILSQPSTEALIDETYQYQVIANDPNNDPLIFSLDSAPSGLSINANSGLINWLPSASQQGPQGIIVRVTDSGGLFATQLFAINVTDSLVNTAPSIESIPNTTAIFNTLYTYQAVASDSDGNTLNYRLDTAPDGMTANSATGLVTWTPAAGQQGANTVVLRVEDGSGGFATQTFSIVVGEGVINQSPVITSSPLFAATVNTLYSYQVIASDADGDALSYAVQNVPSGLSISNTGLISWTPDITQLGVSSVSVSVSDNNGGASTQVYSISVGGDAGDLTPVVTSIPNTNATVGDLFIYDMDAVDPQGNILSFELQTAPEGMVIDSVSGVVNWTPRATQTGANSVVIIARSPSGEFVTQSFSVSIGGPANNQAPIINSNPVLLARAGETYSYTVAALDNDNDALNYQLVLAPSGMSINAADGAISWVPMQNQVGEYEVVLEVQDGNGGVANQSFTIFVSESPLVENDTEKPIVIINLSNTRALVDDSITISVTAIDNLSVASQSLLVDGNPIALNPNGQAVFTSSIAKVFSVVARATDAAGNQASAVSEITFTANTGDTLPPIVEIVSPAESTILSDVTEIIGTVSDDNLSRFIVEYSRQGENEFVRLAESDSQIDNDVLASFDPTMLRNGFYDVRITAEDTDGNSSVVSTVYEADGEAKVGNYSFQVIDLDVPVAGLPMKITRSYDSRDVTTGDFGAGWNLQVSNMEVSENGPIGVGWRQAVTSNFIFPVYNLLPTRSHKVTVTFPDGRVDEFGVRLAPASSTLFPFGFLIGTSIEFVPLEDTASTLVALDNVRARPVVNADGSVQLFNDLFNSDLVNPTRYQLTDDDGTVYIINQNTGLERLSDANGNTLTIGDGGVLHSSGKSIVFNRDSAGRITSITDPKGNVMTYRYDFYGDLVAVTDRSANKTTFTYNSEHGLVEIIDPRGVSITRNEYDDDGRLVAIVDPDGNRTEISSDLVARRQTVTDRLGNKTTFGYDENGYVISETNALGNTTTFAYDSFGRQVSETDPLGNETTKTFDISGNTLTETDPLGNVTTRVYDAGGRELSVTDVRGNVANHVYDARGNLLSTSDVSGNVTEVTIGAQGLPATLANVYGDTIIYTYDEFGNLATKTNSLGHLEVFTTDGNGNVITQAFVRTDASGTLVTDTTQFEYDAQDRQISETDPLGNVSRTEYDSVGNIVAKTDKLGRRTEMLYDGNNRLIETRYPDGSTLLHTYDAEGNKVSMTDRNGNVTRYFYDAIYQLIRVSHPDGAEEQMEYDAAGRMVAAIDANGNRTEYVYDAGGRRIQSTDALGNSQYMEYDEAGNLVRHTDENGNETAYRYNALGLQTEVSFADGSSTANSYNVRRIASVTDQLGQGRQYQYDTVGRLLEIEDAQGNSSVQGFDEVGNRVSQIDAEGKTTRWEFNSLNQAVAETLPLGQRKESTYNALNQLISETDFNGNTVSYTYDINTRPILIEYSDGQSKSYTYDSNGNRLIALLTKASGDTELATYTYDSRDRLLSESKANGYTLSYTYDAVGNRIETQITRPDNSVEISSYTYDALNRLASVTDSANGVSVYAYDAVGNMTELSYPNGSLQRYTYDALNRIVAVKHLDDNNKLLRGYSYTLDAMGKVISVLESDGRSVNYAYDSLNRVVQEDIDDPVNGDKSISYAYDAVGNRLLVNEDGVEINFVYDENDRLQETDIESFAYDQNGNTVSKTSGADVTLYVYDAANKLRSVVTPSSISFDYSYDIDENRVAKSQGGTQINYLVDRNRKYAQTVLESNGNSETLYSYGHDLISQRIDGDEYFYHYDKKGTVKSLSNAASDEVTYYSYDAYGSLINETANINNKHRFTGEYFDEDLQHYYLRARYYAPKLGRFTQMDNWQGDNTTPSTLNKYLYALADPVNNIDPSGNTALVGYSIGTTIAIRNVLVVATIGYAVTVVILNVDADLLWSGVMMAVNSRTPAAANPPDTRQIEHDNYKDFCEKKPYGNSCSALSKKIDHLKQCIRLIRQWDAKWQPGRHELNSIANYEQRLQNLKNEHNRNCT